MDMRTSAEQNEIIDSSAAFLAAQMSTAQSRPLFEGATAPAVSPESWAASAELGWLVLGLDEQHDGVGAGLADEVLLFREIGRADAPGPFIATVLAARVAALAGDTALAAEIAGGRAVGLVIPGAHDTVGADGTLDGPVQLVDATAGLALVATPDVAAIVDVAGLGELTTVSCVDPTALLQRAFAGRVTPLVAIGADVDPVERRGQVLVAAVLAGISEWARDTAARHAIDRVQFDKPIGVNQAIKHPCADAAVQSQLAFAQTLFAALAIDEGRGDAEFQALSARIAAADAAEHSTATLVQTLGGMGFTHEHDAHLYAKRAMLLAHFFGESSVHLTRLLELPEAQ
jgi:alkylation response protein AidB-like acyl-CoA dehydrogenase